MAKGKPNAVNTSICLRVCLRIFLKHLRRLGLKISWSLREWKNFFSVEKYYGDIVGMNVGSVEFCPNNKPPELQKEILPWL